MASAQAGGKLACALALLGLSVAVAPSALAIEAFDGRIQAHGFVEMQIRALDRNFEEEIDLSQWYNVFNLELEGDILPDGWGPFDLLQAYVRVEARYDAIYSHGFGMFPSVSTFGNSSKRLPLRLRDALDQDYGGTINANAQANPPGFQVFRVPEAGDLDPDLVYQHPRGTLDAPRYHERDPVGWVIEVVSDESIDYQRDEDGEVLADPKNPLEKTDLVTLYQTRRSQQLFANLTQAQIANLAAIGDPIDTNLTTVSTFLLDEDDPSGNTVVVDASGEPVIGCGEQYLGRKILCRAIPTTGDNGNITSPTSPQQPGPNVNVGSQGSSDDEAYHKLLDQGGLEVTDPLTGETATVAELYGDIVFVRDADGNLVPDRSMYVEGEGVTGLGSRIAGAGVTMAPDSANANRTLPAELFDAQGNPVPTGGTGRLVGFNATCSTNRKDSRNAYATDLQANFEYDAETRQQILSSGIEGTCLDNRPEATSILKRRAFPGFDTLFDQEGADAELGVNPDFANPELANRTGTVSTLTAEVDAIFEEHGFPSIEDGGLNGTADADKDAFLAEQDALNAFAPYFRGIAPLRDDPAFYALEPVIDWRFTTREIKGAEGGAGATLLMGPWLPKNFFKTMATLNDRANPIRGRSTPTLVARLSNEDYGVDFFESDVRASGDRYTDFDVAAMQRVLDEDGYIPLNESDCPPGAAGCSAPSRYIPDEANVKRTGTVFDPNNPGQTIQAVVGLDFSDAKFGPDPVDPTLGRVDELVTLLGESGIRLRRNRFNTTTGAVLGSQAALGPYPNDILQQADTFAEGRVRGLGLVPFQLLQRSGASLGGDWSGILPCVNTVRQTQRQSAPLGASLEARLAGFEFQPTPVTDLGCVPFTNITSTGGFGEQPMRPAADVSNLLGLDLSLAQGNYIPSQGLLRALETVSFDDPQFNFNQAERSWNRGASQSDTYELKEAYADMEFIDSRLWIRFGLQNIVWGKTELFRTTDQFNPQDLALASLPSLEESRIAVLSARAVYSLYNIGPLEDVRVELAANFDSFDPSDLGACGEPYTFDLVCALTVGFAAHGLTGIGVAGTDRPPDAWDDVDGIEFGGRVEFRWDRFSFAIVDFYGYNDFPYPDLIQSYFRDVDTTTGRMRRVAAGGPCENAGGFIDRVPVPAVDLQPVPAPAPGQNAPLAPGLAPGTPYVVPVDYMIWSAGNTRLAQEVDFKLRRAKLNPLGDPSAVPSGADTPDPIDDWVKHPLAYTVQGIGIDPGCLKPGGIAGQPNENRFDRRIAPDQPLEIVRDADGDFAGIDSDGDGEANFMAFAQQGLQQRKNLPSDRGVFVNNFTMGQWEREGSSVDDALRWHPANQQLFALTCLGTVTIVAALDPAACAWTLFGSPQLLNELIEVPLSELVALSAGGERQGFVKRLQDAIIGNTKDTTAGLLVFPLVGLNRDARDGLTTAISEIVTGDDPLNPGDLDDFSTIGNSLTAQQQALLGCGPFFGTRCDSGSLYNANTDFTTFDARKPPPARPNNFWTVDDTQVLEYPEGVGGIDVLNAEPSAFLQSFPGFEGTAEVKGTYTQLARNANKELQRLGDGSIDLAECNDPGDPCIDPALLNADQTKFKIPDGYLAELDELEVLEVGLVVLEENVIVPDPVLGIADPNCPIVVNGVVDNSCAGIDQISERIAFLQGQPGGTQTAEYTQLTAVGGQYDRQNTAIKGNMEGNPNPNDSGQEDLIRAQQRDISGFTDIVLQSFRVGGNSSGEDRSRFGRTTQVVGPDGELIEIPLAGNLVDGLEEFGPVDSWVTWSNAAQPGTLGNAGLVEIEREWTGDVSEGQVITEVVSKETLKSPQPYVGGPVCTRYDPGSPYADDNGIVKLPGCRGALSVSVNTTPPPAVLRTNVYNIDKPFDGTVEVVFEDFYDPRVDGCIFAPTLDSRDGKVYKVQAVNTDGSQDNATQAVLDATCFNRGLHGVQSTTQFGFIPFQAIDPATDLDPFGNPILQLQGDGTLDPAMLVGASNTPSTHRRRQDPLLDYIGSVGPTFDPVPAGFSSTLWHPWASCLQSSALSGAGISGIQTGYGPQSSVATAARVRPWSADSGGPLAVEFTRAFKGFATDADGNFVVDRGLPPDSAEADEISQAAGARSRFVCDVRTRDFENDFFEGVLRQDLDGDGLVASGAQMFSNEMAAVSWNLLMFLTSTSCNSVSGGDDLADADCYDPSKPWALNRCSFSNPQFCRNVKGFLGVAGLRRNDYRAGGNGQFGRRDFIWHSGGEVVLNYARRNVFGISADFAEDRTKTNWGVEFTWIGAVPFFDNNAFASTSNSDAINLTVSVDRPTFINFLNANRTFFMNSQWFFQYLTNYNTGFFSSGPFNALFTFAVFTGYYQDRLLPQVVTVYDFRSQSGGFLPQVSYRFTEAFSITVGVSFFIGRSERITMPLNGIAPTANRAGKNAYTDGTERLLSLFRGRDEAFMRIRWTF